MNLQQLEYVVAIDSHRHFVKAAEHCFVTQATLSMMLKKLEEELGVTIFDRSKQPVTPTEIGQKIIRQAKVVLHETNRMSDLIREEKNEYSGTLRIGIIPTLAPYLLPLFMDSFLSKYPLVNLKIAELPTQEIINRLERQNLDLGLVAIPLHDPSLQEQSLFYEDFVVYTYNEPGKNKTSRKKFILAKDIDVNRLWLLEEDHCLRAQVINLCELKNQKQELHRLDFETGSIETLKKLVQINQGITILPGLALNDLPEKQRQHIRYFKDPTPAREIGIITYRHFIKENLIHVLKEEILSNIPDEMKDAGKKEVIEVK